MSGELVPATNGGELAPSLSPGQELFAAIMDEFGALGIKIPRAAIAIAARHGKMALEDGCEPDVVLIGCLVALRQGKGRFAQDYIAEIAVVKGGHHLSRREYEQLLNGKKVLSSGSAQAEKNLLARALKDPNS